MDIKIKAIIYIRVSDDHQVDGTSLEFQEQEGRKYCEKKGMEVVKIFIEEGESAKDLSLNNRKEFLKAIEFCRKNNGKIQAFVVLRVNRFARNTEDHFAVRKILLSYGTTLHSVTEIIGNKPQEKVFETMSAAFAEYENAIRKQQCSDGMSQKINQGIWPWCPPIGYRPNGAKKRGEKKTEPDPIHEKIFPIIQQGLKEYQKGIYSMAELARLFDQYGLKRATGKKTTIQVVDRITSDYLKFYSGILHNPFTDEDIKGQHKAMITSEEMYRIQLIRSGKGVNNIIRDKYNPLFPLRRSVLCFACNKPMTGSISTGRGGKKYPHYFCKTKDCIMKDKTIPKDTLEKEFIKYLAKITPKQKFLTVYKESVIDLWQEEGQKYDLEAQKWQKVLDELQIQRKTIFDMIENHVYTPEVGKERLAEKDNQILAAKISLSESRIEQFDIEAAVIYATKFISDVGRQWFDLTPKLRPRFQKLLFPLGLTYDKNLGFGTAKLGLVYSINEQSSADLSYVVDPAVIETASRQCECRVLPLYDGP